MNAVQFALVVAIAACVAVVAFVWFGYGLLAFGLVRSGWLRRLSPLPDGFGEVSLNTRICAEGSVAARADDAFQPPVTLVIAAYNEREWVEAKVANCLALDYPEHLLELLFVTDGSTDGTPERLRLHSPRIVVHHETARLGKIAAVNRVVPFAKGEILVFTDANTMLNPEAIRRMVGHFAYGKVGCVAGEKRVADASGQSSSGRGEGLYWRYESALKRMDSRIWSVVGAAGELFAVRRSLWKNVESDALIEDFLISVRLVQDGWRAVYEPGAVASEAPSADVREEFRRKVRICAGGFQSLVRLRGLWKFWRHGLFGLAYWGHRGFRWALAPFAFFALIPLLVASAVAVHPAFWFPALALGAVVAAAAVCWRRELRGLGTPRLARLPYYFVVMNWAAVMGLIRFVRGRQSVVWEKARRAGSSLTDATVADTTSFSN